MHPEEILDEVRSELDSAIKHHPRPSSSFHEAYAVILEELDELWDEVKKKDRDRNLYDMREEAIQVAAMAVRFILDTL